MKKLFKSIWFPITGYLLAVGFNLPHLVEAYTQTGVANLPAWYPWIMFIVVDLGILILALKDKTSGAMTFAVLVFILNLFVFWKVSPVPDGVYNVGHKALYYIPGFLISAIPAFFVFWFSELIAKEAIDAEERDNTQEALWNELEAARNEAETTRNKLAKQRKELEHLRKVAEYAGRPNESLLKTAANRKKQISSNGMSKEDRARLLEEIKAMLKAAGK